MKNKYSLFRLAIALSVSLAASFNLRSQTFQNPDIGPTPKTAGTGYRIVASSSYSFVGGEMLPTDSAEYFFSSAGTDVYDSYETFSAIDDGSWKPYSRYSFRYDHKGRVRQTDLETWDAATEAYLGISRKLDSLDASGQLVLQLTQHWDEPSSSYIAWQQTFYLRNSAHQILDQYAQSWSNAGWIHDRHIVNQYNEQGKRVAQVSQRWRPSIQAWRNTDSFSTVYDVAGIIPLRNCTFTWDTVRWMWKPVSRQSITYGPGGRWKLTLLESANSSGGWTPVSLDSTAYTAAKNPSVNFKKAWSPAKGSFENQSRITHAYNMADLLTSSVSERWVSGRWSTAAKGAYEVHKYYEVYSTPFGVAGQIQTAPVLLLSPNPANQILYFSFTSEAPASFAASIIDARGQVMQSFSAEHVTEYNKSISTAAMPTGNYFVRVLPAGGEPLSQVIRVKH